MKYIYKASPTEACAVALLAGMAIVAALTEKAILHVVHNGSLFFLTVAIMAYLLLWSTAWYSYVIMHKGSSIAVMGIMSMLIGIIFAHLLRYCDALWSEQILFAIAVWFSVVSISILVAWHESVRSSWFIVLGVSTCICEALMVAYYYWLFPDMYKLNMSLGSIIVAAGITFCSLPSAVRRAYAMHSFEGTWDTIALCIALKVYLDLGTMGISLLKNVEDIEEVV